MKIAEKIKEFFWILLMLLMSTLSYADIVVNITATMIEPACNLRSENSNSPLKINFGTLNQEALNTSTSYKDFSLYITECNFNKDLAVELQPKSGNTLLYNGKKILATSTEGLGIDFKEVTGGIIRSLEVSKTQRIYPERMSVTQYRMDLQAQLVSAVPIDQLTLGEFSSTMTVLVTYY